MSSITSDPQPQRLDKSVINWRAEALALAITLIGLAVAMVLLLHSNGFYHDDDANHYEFAIGGWTDATLLWHMWARPGYNLPAALVGHFFGVFGCRVFSAIQTAIVAFLAYRIARKIAGDARGGQYLSALAPAFVWLQPLTMTLALTTLTETPAALYMTLGVWLFMTQRRVLGCLALSALFVTRYETMGLAPIIGIALVWGALAARDWKVIPALKTWWLWACAGALVLCPLAYAAVAYFKQLPPGSSPLLFVNADYTDEYGVGSWSHFLNNWLDAAGPAMLALAAGGAVCFVRRAILPAAMAAGLVMIHTLIYHFALTGSGGYARFLIPISGLTAALAAAGLVAVLGQRRRLGIAVVCAVLGASLAAMGMDRSYLLGPPPLVHEVAGLVLALVAVAAVVLRRAKVKAALATLAIVVACGVMALCAARQIRPLTIDSSTMHIAVREAVEWVSHSQYAERPGVTSHVLVPILRPNTDIKLDPQAAVTEWENSPAGTLFFWDNIYCVGPPRAPKSYQSILAREGERLCTTSNGPHIMEVYVRAAH